MADYRYFVDQGVVEVFAAAELEERARLQAAFERLAANPNQRPDQVTRSPSGREICGKFFGNWLVRYWDDAPVKVVVIVEVKWT